MDRLTRRRVLRGVVDGGAVTVALPLLNIFLNGNGTALASGAPMPVRFGTWFWGCGMNKSIFVPKKTGVNFELPEEIEALKPVRGYVNLFSGYDVYRDANPSLCHTTGWIALRSGIVPATRIDRPGETIDVTVANKIGKTTRFRSLSATATGDIRDSFNYENQNTNVTPEWSPIQFYTRVFGPDFQDPNAPSFTPNPVSMVRKSVLSGVIDSTASLSKKLGAEDKVRMDQYYTGLRELERQLDAQLKKPDPIAACVAPKSPGEIVTANLDAALVGKRHNMMTDLFVMAVACDQTRVINMTYANSFPATARPGYDKPHHSATHEEPVDEALGYQPNVSWYTRRSMEAWAYFVEAFTKVKEGDGVLLDNMLLFANSDQSFAKVHGMDGIPMFTAGRAGGKLKGGVHVAGAGQPGSRVGYTIQKVLGLDIDSWGSQSNTTSKEIGEVLA
jgi:hypothetical protein